VVMDVRMRTVTASPVLRGSASPPPAVIFETAFASDESSRKVAAGFAVYTNRSRPPNAGTGRRAKRS